MTRNEETRIVKNAFKSAGLPCVSVGHGTGTSWGWLHVNIGENPSKLAHDCEGDWERRAHCPACIANRALYEQAEALVSKATGRTGEYGGRTNILAQ